MDTGARSALRNGALPWTRWRWRLEPLLLVANGNRNTPVSAPAFSADAERIKANWSAVLPGQPIPLVGEDGAVNDDPLFCDLD